MNESGRRSDPAALRVRAVGKGRPIPTPSFPRRRESRHATVAPPAARSEVMDSRLRGNDELVNLVRERARTETARRTAQPPPSPRRCSGVHRAARDWQEAPAPPLAAKGAPERVRGDGR
ncbi:hypothetical protein DC429_02800 [Arthrobacter sp. TPD3018]|nr:hypothetical protein DC425_02795 [Sphingomonas sp. TPD3009]PVE60872.1 hypothetical protein DC429_02800 [Arthrobacter sp. TPD3018]PVE87551.1 hypothetical protein DC431_02795 [Sphingomonas melonis]